MMESVEIMRTFIYPNLIDDLLCNIETTSTTTSTTTTAATCTFPCLCSGTTSYTLWQALSTDTMYITISTSSCNFTQTPLYYASISSTSSHWCLASYNAVYSPSTTSFIVYATSLVGWSATSMLSYANTYGWYVTWFGMYSWT